MPNPLLHLTLSAGAVSGGRQRQFGTRRFPTIGPDRNGFRMKHG
jgi:hypothetical protein